MKATRHAASWIENGDVTLKIRLDYSIIEDPGTRKRLYIPMLRSSRRLLLRMFTKAHRAVAYRDEVLRRCRWWKEIARAAEAEQQASEA